MNTEKPEKSIPAEEAFRCAWAAARPMVALMDGQGPQAKHVPDIADLSWIHLQRINDLTASRQAENDKAASVLFEAQTQLATAYLLALAAGGDLVGREDGPPILDRKAALGCMVSAIYALEDFLKAEAKEET